MVGKNQSIDRLSELAQQWFLSEPLLFAAWTTHRIVEQPRIATVRVGRGMIEVNPQFIASLDTQSLREVMKFEAVRIILKHPYERRKQNAALTYEASNLAIQECMQMALPMPRAKDRFGSKEHDHKFFEYYYQLLHEELFENQSSGSENESSSSESSDGSNEGEAEIDGADSDVAESENEPEGIDESPEDDGASECSDDGECEDGECEGSGDGAGECEGSGEGENGSNDQQGVGTCDGPGRSRNGNAGKGGERNPSNPSNSSKELRADLRGQESVNETTDAIPPTDLPSDIGSDLPTYCDHELVGPENTSNWDQDTFLCERINEVIAEIEASQSWGTVPGGARESILATLVPKLDYRRVLKAFRANIISTHRRLTRMKPSRRYGFDYMGSRRDFCTKLLFAVDVSGSVGTADVRAAFSIVNRMFKYGVESIDVIWFDTQVRNEKPLQLKKAWREFEVDGRGGTDFQPLMDYVDEHRQYDGLVVFTDGIAPVPALPQRNRRTRIVWLFNHEEYGKVAHEGLSQVGLTAFVHAD